MKKSKLDAPHIKKQVVTSLAVGKSQSRIAKDIGISQSQVSRFAKREDIQAFIEEEQKKLLEVVPDSVENIKGLVREMKDIPKNEYKRRELSYRASRDVLKSVGLFPSPVQSQTLVNIYSKKTSFLTNPAVQKFLDDHDRQIYELTKDDNEELEDSKDNEK